MYDTDGLPVTTLDLGRVLCEDVIELLPEMGTNELRLILSLVEYDQRSGDTMHHRRGWLSKCQRDTGWVLPKESKASHARENIGMDI